jgi:hypothetical protein
MVAGGLPERRPDHLEAVARMALAMRDEVAAIAERTGLGWLAVRIEIDKGPVGGSDRPAQIYLRPLERHREHGEPDGVPRAARADPGHRPCRGALGPGFTVRPRGMSDVKERDRAGRSLVRRPVHTQLRRAISRSGRRHGVTRLHCTQNPVRRCQPTPSPTTSSVGSPHYCLRSPTSEPDGWSPRSPTAVCRHARGTRRAPIRRPPATSVASSRSSRGVRVDAAGVVPDEPER